MRKYKWIELYKKQVYFKEIWKTHFILNLPPKVWVLIPSIQTVSEAGL